MEQRTTPGKRLSLYFTRPFGIRVEEEDMPEPGPGQVLVEARLSGISPGTEMLFYHGLVPGGIAVDATIKGMDGGMSYPLKYGYSSVGRIAAVGRDVRPEWIGRRVFTFHPHESHYLAAPGELVPVPDGISGEDAVFLPSMETAATLVLDGEPCLGETVAVVGQGIIGLLATMLLAMHPLERLVTVDRFANRRRASLASGASVSLDPDGDELGRFVESMGRRRADLVYELSGVPRGLDQAIDLAGFGGRIVVGSWYGTKRDPIELGGRFHRERITIRSSQVSTLPTRLMARWTRERRLALAWRLLGTVRPSRHITQVFPLERADEAYALLDTAPDRTIQVVFSYGNGHKPTTRS